MSGKPGKAIDVQARVYQVQKWLIEGLTYAEMHKRSKAKKWDVSQRTIDRYVEKAKKDWVKKSQESIEVKRAQKIEELEALKRSLKARYKGHPAGIMAIARVESHLIKLQGLAQPQQFEIAGKDGGPIQTKSVDEIDYDKLPPEVLKAIVSARREKS